MTPLDEVYDFFLSKVTDYSFIQLNQTGDLEKVLFKHLRSSIVKFTSCKKDLTIDEANSSFVSDLDLFEKEILADLMVVQYVSSKILNIKNMEQYLSTNDYKTYSQANFLKELSSLKKDLEHEVSQLMSTYSFRDGLEELLS